MVPFIKWLIFTIIFIICGFWEYNILRGFLDYKFHIIPLFLITNKWLNNFLFAFLFWVLYPAVKEKKYMIFLLVWIGFILVNNFNWNVKLFQYPRYYFFDIISYSAVILIIFWKIWDER